MTYRFTYKIDTAFIIWYINIEASAERDFMMNCTDAVLCFNKLTELKTLENEPLGFRGVVYSWLYCVKLKLTQTPAPLSHPMKKNHIILSRL